MLGRHRRRWPIIEELTAVFDTDGGPKPPEIMSDHQNI